MFGQRLFSKRTPTTPRSLGQVLHAVFGLLAVLFLLLLLFLGLWTCLSESYALSQQMQVKARFMPPGSEHFFGMDHYGRDLFWRVARAALNTLSIAIPTILLALLLGFVLGLAAGYRGGKTDWILMRFNDALLAFPSILLALLFLAVWGNGRWQLVAAMAIMFMPSFARVVRSAVLQVRDALFLARVRVAGASFWRILSKHLLPILKPTLISASCIGLANAILAESSLSFLGFGLSPLTESWGHMLSAAQATLFQAPWTAVFPGLTLILTVLSFFTLGELWAKQGRGQEEPVPNEQASLEASDEPKTLVASANLEHEYLLEVEALSVFHQHQKEALLKKIDLAIRPGERWGLLGRSGSGKSLTLMAIADLLEVGLTSKARKIQLAGRDITRPIAQMHRHERGARRAFLADQIGICYQDALAALNPLMTIQAQMLEAFRPKQKISPQEKQKRLQHILEEVGFENPTAILKAYPHELSGGMRQRILLAMALLPEPKILMMDEPTSALDMENAERVLRALERVLAKRQIALIFVSHDLAITARLCQKVAVLDGGCLLEQGDLKTHYLAPESSALRALLAAAVEDAEREAEAGLQAKALPVQKA